MIKKLTVTFKDDNLIKLFKITKNGKHKAPTEAIKIALQILDSLQKHANKGYGEIIIRNPYTAEEKLAKNKHLIKLSDDYYSKINKKNK